ncbi:MAG: flagellar basal body rod protein FlgB [Neptuniibacter sp.]
MIETISGTTSQLLNLALDASLLRHEVIANNIANVDTPNFKAQRLTFDQHLQSMASMISTPNNETLETQIGALKHELETSPQTEQEGEVELDQEMVRLSENTLLYQALLQAKSNRSDLIKMAIQEGKR